MSDAMGTERVAGVEADVLLACRGLEVRFAGRDSGSEMRAVDGIDLDLRRGEVLALVGESGSGKSVTALAVMGLLPPPPLCRLGGDLYWRGIRHEAADQQGRRGLRGREIGMVFQEPQSALNPTWTIGAQVAEPLLLHSSLGAAERRARALALLREVGIPEAAQRLDQYPHELSGGMRQRVCIAIALACDPALLIADEPSTALDVTVQAQILDLLRRLQRERGLSVLFITHDFGVVAEIADRVAVMRYGRLVEEGPVTAIFDAPQHPYTRGLLACRPTLDARHRGRRLPTVDDYLTVG